MGQSNWSELCPELLGCVFERLSFTDLNRVKSVCLPWYSASRGCVPRRNQITWLILFTRSNNNSSCVLFVPEDRDNVYKTRDLDVDFLQTTCHATYGSWLLMMDIHYNFNILNPLTGEKIDLPPTRFDPDPPEKTVLWYLMTLERPSLACLWIDDRSKDYTVVWKMSEKLVFAKKGHNNKWRGFPYRTDEGWVGEQLVYEHTAQNLYYYRDRHVVKIWCLSGDDPRLVFEYYPPIKFSLPFWDSIGREISYRKNRGGLYKEEYVDHRVSITLSRVSGQVLKVAPKSQGFFFLVYKMHPIKRSWVMIDSLGDEVLILDMGITVVAKDIPGIKSNSIYFCGVRYGRKDPDHVFVFDLTTHQIETLPKCVLSLIHFSDARWFFPSLSN